MLEWKIAIQTIINWIEDNVENEPSLSKMADMIGYSPCYCSYLFHSVSGITLKNYMAKRKLSYAAVKLRDTDDRILDIAILYGYSSQEALTRAFVKSYGCTPYAYRKNPRPIKLSVKQDVLTPFDYRNEGDIRMGNVKDANMRFEYIPEHKYIGIWDMETSNYGDFFHKYNCDDITGTVESMRNVSHEIVGCHAAGWFYENGKKGYFYGLGVPMDYAGEIPEGFVVKEFPASMYMKFYHPTFDYLLDNGEVMGRVETLAWNYNPRKDGYEWNEEVCQDYQIHYPEYIGYEVLRPVRKLR